MSLLSLLTSLACLCPLLIFLDYHRRKNINRAIIYVVVFFLLWNFLLPGLIRQYGLYVAAAAPFFLLFLALLSRKRNR